MRMIKNLLLTFVVNLITIGFARGCGEQPHELDGVWNVVAYIHPGKESELTGQRCMTFTFDFIIGHAYILRRKSMKGSEHVLNEWIVVCQDRELSVIYHAKDRVRKETRIDVVDYVKNDEMAFFMEKKNLYVLLSRTMILSAELSTKFIQIQKNGWTLVLMDQTNCS